MPRKAKSVASKARKKKLQNIKRTTSNPAESSALSTADSYEHKLGDDSHDHKLGDDSHHCIASRAKMNIGALESNEVLEIVPTRARTAKTELPSHPKTGIDGFDETAELPNSFQPSYTLDRPSHDKAVKRKHVTSHPVDSVSINKAAKVIDSPKDSYSLDRSECAVTSSDVNVLSTSNSSTAILPIDSRMAITHQGNVRYFGDMASGKQCTPFAYLAIAMHCIEKSCLVWSGDTIMTLLAQGSKMYETFKPTNYDHFSVDDLPEKFVYGNIEIEQECVKSRSGFIETVNQTPDDILNNVYNNLTDLFEGILRGGLLLIMAGYTTAVLRDGCEYWIIDSHSRNVYGKPSSNGTAGMFKYSDLLHLARYVVDMSALLSHSGTSGTAYEMTQIQFRQVNDATKLTQCISPNSNNTPRSCKTNHANKDSPSTSSVVVATPLLVKSEPKTSNSQDDKRTTSSYTNKWAKYYAENEAYRNRRLLRSAKQYRDNQERRDYLKNASAEKYQNNQERRDYLKNASAEKYQNNQERRDYLKNASVEKYRVDEEFRHNVQKRSIEKYRVDEEFRHNVQNSSVEKYRVDGEFRHNVQNRSVEKYRVDEKHRAYVKNLSIDTYLEKKSKLGIIQNAIQEFRHKSHLFPTTICCVCTRLWFAEKVKVCKITSYTHTVTLTECIEYYKKKFSRDEKQCLYICHTCSSYIGKGKTPPQATVNSMQICDPDPTFETLNTLEQQLISLFLPFEKIITLPRSKQSAVRGPVVCVPSNINLVTNVLPVPAGESKIIPVYLKRRLVYQGHSNYKEVDTVKLNRALTKLKLTNPLYADVEINNNWNDAVDMNLLVGNKNGLMDSDISPEENQEQLTGEENDIVVSGNAMDSCLQPVDMFNEIEADDLDSISIAPAEGNKPVSMFHEPQIEAKAFPSLFYNGKNTYDANRDTKISRCDYYKARIFSADRRFASNTSYIFFCQYAYEAEKLLSSISINLRKGSEAKNINRAMLADPEYRRSLIKSDKGFKFFEPARGSPAFWKKTMSNLFACLRNLGLPTFFITLTSAELTRWSCHLGAILSQQGDFRSHEDIMNMDYRKKCEVLKSNPVTAVQMFYHRVEAFFKLILQGPAQPIGKIKDYFYRVEFQSRGAPHLHCLFWIENAPQLNTHSHDDIVSFIDKYISGRMPDKYEDPELHEIVSSVQTHSSNHSASCRKGKSRKKCRYNFPRPSCDVTFIVEPKEDCAESVTDKEQMLKQLFAVLESGEKFTNNNELYAKCGLNDFFGFQDAMRVVAKKPSVVLKRSSDDIYVNNYNADILRAWNANIDIQFVLDPYSCIMYIVSYIAKSESELGEILKRARDELINEGVDCNDAKGMKSLTHKYFSHREVSVQEAVVRLAGYKLQQFSRQVIFVPTNEDDVKMSKPLNQILNSEDENNSGIWLTSIYDRYYGRPNSTEFNDMCLAQFAADFRVLSSTEAKSSKSPHKYNLGKGLGSIMRRTRSDSAVIRYCRHSPHEKPEQHYLTLLKLFLPHRKANDTKPLGFHTYEEYFTKGTVRKTLNERGVTLTVASIVKGNEKIYNIGESGIDEAVAIMNEAGHLEDAWTCVAPNAECERQTDILEGVTSTEPDNEAALTTSPEFEPESNSRRSNICAYEISSSTLKPLLQSMNTTQQKIFYHIRDWCIKDKNHVPNLTPFRVFVTGGAGVGKSHLIKCIYGACTKILRNPESPGDITVLLLAPTGTAAHNIKGQTIHSVFKIPIEPSKQYQPLSCDSLNSLRVSLENLKIIIVDEVSMVSGRLLEFVDGRLRQIMGVSHSNPSGLFGNVSVLAVGDFYQLSPVLASPLVLPTAWYGNQVFRENFEIIELTEIMRQRDDAVFADVLNKLRTKSKRKDIDSDADRMLRSRTDLPDEPVNALHVFATNQKVTAYNDYMVDRVCDNYISIPARDFEKQVNGKLKALVEYRKGAYTELPDCLKIGLNARVMLMRNVDVSHGLVNGVFGTVVRYSTEQSEITQIYVKFDDNRIGEGLVQQIPQDLPANTISIKRVEEPLKIKTGKRNAKSNVTRRQFPLKLGWAATVHKVQGMSVSQIVFDMSGIFAAGQAYVALSRVTSLNGLFLKNYDPNLIYRDERVHEQIFTLPILEVGDFASNTNCEFVVHNVQGIHSKLDDIKKTYSKYAKVMCLTETWLSSTSATENIALDGFNTFRNDRRSTNCRGGVAVYVRNEIPINYIEIPSNENHIEIVMLRLTMNFKNICLSCIYRPGSANLRATIDQIRICINIAEKQSDVDICVITGDLNENLNSDAPCPIHDVFMAHGFSQLVNESTYISGSLLDVLYVKGDVETMQSRVTPVYFSDHEMLTVTL